MVGERFKLNTAGKIFKKVRIVFLIMGGGVYAVKKNIISDKGSKELCSLLLSIVTPFLIINSYIRPFDAGLLKTFIIAAILASLVNLV